MEVEVDGRTREPIGVGNRVREKPGQHTRAKQLLMVVFSWKLRSRDMRVSHPSGLPFPRTRVLSPRLNCPHSNIGAVPSISSVDPRGNNSLSSLDAWRQFKRWIAQLFFRFCASASIQCVSKESESYVICCAFALDVFA